MSVLPDMGKIGTDIKTRLGNLERSKANLASPTLTGTPKAPTAAKGTKTTQIATTAFVGTECDAVQAYANAIMDAFQTFNTTNGIV